MAHRTNPESIEKEEKLQQAIAAFLNKDKTASQAIRDFNIPRKTFYRRITGIPPHNKAHEKLQFLSHAEEKELVRWITCLTEGGYPL